MALKEIWNKLSYALEAHNIFEPSKKVMDEMEKDGWSFKFKNDFITASLYSSVSYSFIVPVTPEGEEVFGPGKEALHNRYGDARREAAKKVYGIK